ncbi:MAG: 4a-hydroxytetrahydrobiopterin dehydratase [Patescibacteria group bacterium]
MTESLINKHCPPCEKKTPPLKDEAVKTLSVELKRPWQVVAGAHGLKKLSYEFTFPTFLAAVDFVNKIAPVAEAEGHHPDLYIFYNRVRVELYTHSIGGLSENDFILASKIEVLV